MNSPKRRGGSIRALLAQRCPRCREGRVFRRLLAMHETCPVCRLRFEREPGYFVGAMYVSYALAVPAYAALVLLAYRLVPGWPDTGVFLLSLVPFAPLVPVIVRYSRLIWMYFDRSVNPPSAARPPS